MYLHAIDEMDVTDRAKNHGWKLPSLFTVVAFIAPDESTQPSDFDCYSSADTQAWIDGYWQFVGLVVEVRDAYGDVFGRATVWGIEHGLPTDSGETDALRDMGHGYHDDLIDEALQEAADYLSDLQGKSIEKSN